MASCGVLVMKDPAFVSVRVQVVGGHLEADALVPLAQIAKKYGRGVVHFTTRQGVEIPHIPVEKCEEALQALADAGIPAGGTGPRVRTLSACPGKDCRFGLIDAQGLARHLFESVKDRVLTHKFKIAVTGCPNSCAKPITNDFGVQGARQGGESGYVIFVGGNFGRRVRLADRLPFLCRTEEEVVAVLRDVLDWFCANGLPKERLATVMERVGVSQFLELLQEKHTARQAG